ncbi:MAG: ABC transporter substrate-binding protein, partial [Hydrogenophaga sp.]|nr:ABC transporter substrate-binding protein [Hydrogenophaga sp.]
MKKVWAASVFWLCGLTMAADPVLVGLDAEFGHKTSTSAQAVQLGIEIAIDEINQAGGVLGGRPLKLISRDNRSVTAIGLDNLRELAQMRDLVAVFGGKFSPIYVESLPLVHELGLPLLSPWGSADGITDHAYRPSYTFRLSIKDEWASGAFISFARQQHKATRLGVLLPNTAWGRSNKAALEQAAAREKVSLVAQRWYNWGDDSLLDQYLSLKAAGAQAIVLVANEVEGAVLVRNLAALPPDQRLPVVSHWGVTGGEFVRLTGAALGEVDFAVIQSFSFVGLNTPTA